MAKPCDGKIVITYDDINQVMKLVCSCGFEQEISYFAPDKEVNVLAIQHKSGDGED